MEGMFMATLTVVILLHITTMIRVSFLGVFILVITAVAGYVLTTGLSLGQLVLKKHNSVQRIFNSGIGAYIALAVIFLVSMFVNYGDYIRNIDELHLWALVPKYMLEHGRLPIKAWRLDQNLGTCYFNYFFQAIAGYNEGMMYASAALLHWIGFLLPFGNSKKTNKENLALYCLIMYIALYSVYFYGNKNLYVDIPVAAFAGGVIAWLATNRKTSIQKRIILVVPALLVIYDFKKSVGWLMDLFIILFLVLTLLYDRGTTEGRTYGKNLVKTLLIMINGIYTVIIILLYLMLESGGSHFLLSFFAGDQIAEAGMSQDKVALTLQSYINDVFGKAFTQGKSTLNMTLIYLIIVCSAIMFLYIKNAADERYASLCLSYSLTIVYIYTTAMFFGFLLSASFETSTETVASQRYMAIIGIVFLIIALSGMLTRRLKSEKMQVYVSLFLIVFFSFGINENYLTDTTFWNQKHTGRYYEIKEIQREAEAIKGIVDPEDQVYFLNQNGNFMDEIAVNAARYYLDSQISDYRGVPWQFTQAGCIIVANEYYSKTVEDLPEYLKDGKFEYLWIFKEDSYIRTKLPEVFQMDENHIFAPGQLYKIKKKKKGKMELQLVRNFIHYDDKEIYEMIED